MFLEENQDVIECTKEHANSLNPRAIFLLCSTMNFMENTVLPLIIKILLQSVRLNTFQIINYRQLI